MDNRRYARPGSREPIRSGEPLGDEVELVELTAPSKQRRVSSGTLWIAIVAVGLIGFAAGFSWPRGAQGEPGASAIAVAAPTPLVAAETPDSSLSTSTARPSGRPSPNPTRTPGPNEWRPYDLGIPSESELLDLWTLDGQFLMPVRTFAEDGEVTLSLLTSMTGRTWAAAGVPPAIQELQAGTVFDGRLWFVARVAGVSTTSFELVSTDGRGDWDSLGPTEDLGVEDGGVLVLTHVADRWVVSTYSSHCCDGGPEDLDIRTSIDGVRWSSGRASLGPSEAIRSSFSIGGTLGLVGMRTDAEVAFSFILTTRDGRRWSRIDLSPETAGQVVDVVCSDGVCVRFGTREGPGVSVLTLATSSNGIDWSNVDSPRLPDLSTVAPTSTGFIAMDTTGRTAWSSSDGTEWQPVEVIVSTVEHYVAHFAVNGEYAAAVGQRIDGSTGGSTYVSWAGTVAGTTR